MDLELVAKVLLNEMKNQGLSYDDLAKKSKVPKASLQRYLTYEQEIPLRRYEAICAALSLDPAKVLGWKQNDPEESALNKEVLSILSSYESSQRTAVVQFLKNFVANEETK